MPTFELVAMNPNVAVMTGTQVATKDMVLIVSVEAPTARKALEMGAERAASRGYRVLAASADLHAVKGLKALPLQEAFPMDPALANDRAFHLHEGATLRIGDRPDDFMANFHGWDRPILAIVTQDGEVPLMRLDKSLGPTGFGFSRQAIEESYVTTGRGTDDVVIKVRRDARVVAAHAWRKGTTPGPDRTWFHSMDGEEASAASALLAAVAHARGHDPEDGPSSPRP